MLAQDEAARFVLDRFAARPPRFDPGRIVMTPGAIEVMADNNAPVSEFLARHVTGDWGDVPPEDARANERDLKAGRRLLAAYKLPKDDRIWIITDAVDTEAGDDPLKREVTTVLLPSEY
jgi:hypothetical protein